MNFKILIIYDYLKPKSLARVFSSWLRWWSYSHSHEKQNVVGSDFKYGVGDVIKVQKNEDELLFRNETKNLEFKMKMKLTEEGWQQACFCVLLFGKGDSVLTL